MRADAMCQKQQHQVHIFKHMLAGAESQNTTNQNNLPTNYKFKRSPRKGELNAGRAMLAMETSWMGAQL